MRPIVIAAGGTGGHFFPAEALAAALIERGHRVVLLTDGRSAALNSKVFEGRDVHVLPGAGLAGRGLRRGAAAAFALTAGTVRARGILNRLDPAAIVAFGGYPSVAPVLASRALRRRPPVILHEQNAVLGRANRFLARFARCLALSFSETARIPAGTATAVIGNPVRPAMRALAGLGYAAPEENFRLLVLGGSLGARVLSDVLPAALALLPPGLRARLAIAQQCRKEDLSRVREAYDAVGIAAELATFFDDVPARLAACHLVIARAGASTCAELEVAGRPAILVPLPGAIDDHQRANADALRDSGAAIVCLQPAFSADHVSKVIAELMGDFEHLARLAQAGARIAQPHAASHLADLVEHSAAAAEVRS